MTKKIFRLGGVNNEAKIDRLIDRNKDTKHVRIKSFFVDTSPIVIRYSKDYQINVLHNKIVERLKSQADAVSIKKDLTKLMETPLEDNSVISIKNRDREIEELKKHIRLYTSGEKLNKYIKEASPIVKEYIDLGEFIEVINFSTDDDDHDNYLMTDEHIKRLLVIDRFFKVLSRYVKIDVYRENIIKADVCAVCNGKLINMSYDENNSDQYCLNCDSISTQSESLTYNEGVKTTSSTNKYDVLITYRRELKQFEGKEKIKLPEDLFNKLDVFFTKLGFPVGEEVKKNQIDEFGKTEGTSLSALCNALSAIGYSSLYKHVNKIGKEYWGWKLHDLEKIMPDLISDFVIIQREFPFVKKKRSSNICSQHRLFHQLRLRNVHVAYTDFKFPSLEALLCSEDIWKQMVERTNQFPYIPTFPSDELSFFNEQTGIIVKLKNETFILTYQVDSEDNKNVIIKKISDY